LEIPKDYYLDSTNELKIDGWMYRTAGSGQIQRWVDSPVKPFKGCIDYRRYFRGMYKGKKFFAKQYLKPASPLKSLEASVEYHIQSLLLLEDMGCTPKPMFLTNDTLGMEYIEGKTIKSLVVKTELNKEFAEKIIIQLEENGKAIVNKLASIGRKYDRSVNNILVKENGKVIFIDFDPSGLFRTIADIIKIIRSRAK